MRYSRGGSCLKQVGTRQPKIHGGRRIFPRIASMTFHPTLSSIHSWFARTRSRFATNRHLRTLFDSLWSRPTTWLASTATVRGKIFPWLDALDRSCAINPWGSGLGETTIVPAFARRGHIVDADVLIIGVEHGHEIESLWSRHAARQIVGIDISSYVDDWRNIPRKQAKGTRVAFAQMDGSRLGFRPDAFDIVYCQGVFPHVLDFPRFVDEVWRVLRPAGSFLAISCPPWRTYEGPHMPGFGFDHLLLSEDAFRTQALARDDGWQHWYELDLFNRLTVRDMLLALDERFDIGQLSIAPSRGAAQYARQFPDSWEHLKNRYEELDLMVRLFALEMRPRHTPDFRSS